MQARGTAGKIRPFSHSGSEVDATGPRHSTLLRMFYTYSWMKHFGAIAALLVALVSVPCLQAAEQQYGPGRIVDVEKKARERVLYYLVNTPVTQDDPYYELSLQQGSWLYLAEYTPRHAADSLPDEWKPGAEVQMKLTDKHHAWVRLPGLHELQVIVLKRVPATGDMTAPNAVPVQK